MRRMTTRSVLMLASFVLGILFSSAALAGETTPDSPPKKRLAKINSLAQWGVRKLPGSYSDSYAKRVKELEDAKKVYEQAKALMSPDLKDLPNADGAMKYYKELEDGVNVGALQLECLTHYQKVDQALDDKKVPRPEWLEALDKAIAQLQSQDNETGKQALKSWTLTRKNAQEEIDQLIKRKAPMARVFLTKEDKEAAKAIYSKLVKAQTAIKKQVKAKKPIPAELLAEIPQDAEVAKKFNPAAPAYWGGLKAGAEIYNAVLDLAKNPKGVAEAFGAELVLKGKTKGKKLKYAVKAKANWCYAAVERWENNTGSENADLKWNYGKRFRDVQALRVRKKKLVPWGPVSGFCTTKAAKVTRTGKLKFSGSGNRMNYAVVGWPRENIPMSVAAHVVSITVDPCDPQYWFKLWTHPVPGSLAYSEQEPILWTHRDDSHKEALTAAGVNGLSGLKHMKTKAPAKRAFAKPEWVFRGCYGKGLGYNPLGIKYEKCMNRITNKYIPKFNAANKALKKARTNKAVERAEKRLAKLRSAKRREEDKKCGPTRKKITRKMNKIYTKIVDWHTKNAIESKLDVMQVVRDQKEGLQAF